MTQDRRIKGHTTYERRNMGVFQVSLQDKRRKVNFQKKWKCHTKRSCSSSTSGFQLTAPLTEVSPLVMQNAYYPKLSSFHHVTSDWVSFTLQQDPKKMEVPRTFVNSHFLHVQNRGCVADVKRYLKQLPNRSESFKSLSTGAEKYIRTRALPLYYGLFFFNRAFKKNSTVRH